jgi:hypothetical protein
LDRLLRRGYEDWLKRQLNETIIQGESWKKSPWGLTPKVNFIGLDVQAEARTR